MQVLALYHHLVTILIGKMHDMVKAGEDTPSELWLLKASALSFAVRTYHEKEAKVVEADQVLLTSKIAFSCAMAGIRLPMLANICEA